MGSHFKPLYLTGCLEHGTHYIKNICVFFKSEQGIFLLRAKEAAATSGTIFHLHPVINHNSEPGTENTWLLAPEIKPLRARIWLQGHTTSQADEPHRGPSLSPRLESTCKIPPGEELR